MNLKRRIEALAALGNYMTSEDDALENAVHRAYQKNKWFTPENVHQSLEAISNHYLNKARLEEWVSRYELKEINSRKIIGLVMAGNIPLVGFHDLLAVLITGNKAQIKLSSKDETLLPHLAERMFEIEPVFKEQIEIVDKLKNFDAVIATGSNNSARYFEYYFGKYPHIIRKNRNSVAILTSQETGKDIEELGKDIFQYFGLGCRNVSKLFVPKDYDFDEFLHKLECFRSVMEHEGYKHNYDYNRTILLMNNQAHYATDFIMLTKSEAIASPIASLYFEEYDQIDEVENNIRDHKSDIQCVVSKKPLPKAIPFGKAQQPELWDYADDVDTMEFLLGLN